MMTFRSRLYHHPYLLASMISFIGGGALEVLMVKFYFRGANFYEVMKKRHSKDIAEYQFQQKYQSE